MYKVVNDFGLVPEPVARHGWSKSIPLTERTAQGMLFGNNFMDTLDFDQAFIIQKEEERDVRYGVYRNPEGTEDEAEYWLVIHQ